MINNKRVDNDYMPQYPKESNSESFALLESLEHIMTKSILPRCIKLHAKRKI